MIITISISSLLTSFLIDIVKIFGLVMIISFIPILFLTIYGNPEENKAKRKHQEFLKESAKKTKETYEEMKQDKRFQKFFEDVSSILTERKNEIEVVSVTNNDGFHVLLHKEIKINK